MFTQRQKLIIQHILAHENGIFSAPLCAFISCSPRTLRNEITQINSILKKVNLEIQSSPSKGYYFPFETKNNVYDVIQHIGQNAMYIPSTPLQRKLYICMYLAFAKHTQCSLDTLAENIYCSFSSVQTILAAIRAELKEDVKITTKGKQVCFCGEEYAIRLYLNATIARAYDQQFDYLKQILFHYFQLDDNILYQLYDCLAEKISKEDIILTDKDLFLFLTEYLITGYRSKNGNTLQTNATLSTFETYFRFHHFDELDNISHFSLNQTDILFLNQCFLYKRTLFGTVHPLQLEKSNRIIQTYLDVLQNDFKLNIEQYDKVKQNLMHHLQSLINRLHFHHEEDDSLMKDIKKMYPYAFEMATAIIPIIKEYLHLTVSESELSFIAIHLLTILEENTTPYSTIIVCGSGLGSAQLIQQRLYKHFKNQIIVKACCPSHQLQQHLNKHSPIDFIISSIPLSISSTVPVFHISPFFELNDVENLYKKLQTLSPANPYSYLDGNLFFIENNQTFDADKILKNMINSLFQNGYIDDIATFYQSVEEREAVYSTKYDTIWMPHPMKGLSRTTVISVCLLPYSQDIKMIILCAINPKETSKFQDLYSKIVHMIEDKEIYKHILASKDFVTFSRSFLKL